MIETPRLSKSPQSRRRADLEKKEKNPRRYDIQRLEEAPLIERKVYVAQKTPVFSTRNDLMRFLSAKRLRRDVDPQNYGGCILSRVPTVLRVIAQDGRINGYHASTKRGEPIGWIEGGNASAQEWPTNHVLRIKRDGKKPLLYASKEQAASANGTATPLPDNLWDEDVVFPLLKVDNDKGLYQVGRPLPRTIKTDINFPCWLPMEGGFKEQIDLLVDKKTLRQTIRNLQYLKEQWEDLAHDEEARQSDQVKHLINAQTMILLTLVTDNATPSLAKNTWSKSLQKTAEFLETSDLCPNFLHKNQDAIQIMTNGQFADFLKGVANDIEKLHKSLANMAVYSVAEEQNISRRVVCSIP